MSDTILDLRRAKAVLNLEDEDSVRDQILRETLLPAVDEIIEHFVGWVVKRDRTLRIAPRQQGEPVLLPGTRVLAVISATSEAGPIDVTGITVDDAGIVRPASGSSLPLGAWSLTVSSGMDPIPAALQLAASEVLVTAWENYQSGEPNAFVLSYRAEAWLWPYTNGATFA